MKILGHRGKRVGHQEYENTYEIISRVMEEGADGIETDVISDAQGKLYLIHDEDISKHSNFDKGRLTELTTKDAEKIRIGKTDPYKLPKLKEVLDLFKNQYPDKILNIEIKQKGISALVFKEIEKKQINKQNIIISSFNHEDLLEYRKLDRDIKIGILFESKEEGEEYLEYLKKTKKKLGNAVYHPNINSPLLKELEGEKNIWTVKVGDLKKLEGVKDINIIVDDFTEVSKALKSRLEQKK